MLFTDIVKFTQSSERIGIQNLKVYAMECVHCASKDFKTPGEVLSVVKDQPRPQRSDGELLLRVLTCSIHPGDIHFMGGKIEAIMKPKSFPYIPGGNVCGIVEEADPNSTFKVGECVVASDPGAGVGGMAEYHIVKSSLATKKPLSLNPVEAVAVTTSSISAMQALDLVNVKPGKRVLILGGNGGVGSSVLQLAKAKGAYVVVTASDVNSMQTLGADKVINYKKENWWQMQEFKKVQFDAIIDCVGGNAHWKKAVGNRTVKSGWNGGVFVAVAGDNNQPEFHTVGQLLPFIAQVLGRTIYTSVAKWKPRYKLLTFALKTDSQSKIFEYVEAGKLKPVINASSPFPFNTEGVKKAFDVQASGHAKGKVVVQISSE